MRCTRWYCVTMPPPYISIPGRTTTPNRNFGGTLEQGLVEADARECIGGMYFRGAWYVTEGVVLVSLPVFLSCVSPIPPMFRLCPVSPSPFEEAQSRLRIDEISVIFSIHLAMP